jgi:hypothetical protein
MDVNTKTHPVPITKEHLQLLRAAKQVMAGLDARIQSAAKNGQPVPLYHGIANLYSAIRRSDRARTDGKGPRRQRPRRVKA